MKKLTANDPETQSADILASNIEQLRALFPEAFTEGKIDFEVLKQLLGGAVDEREEKYGLNWHGKRRARQLALTPSTGTLRPCPEDSVDWDTTQNLMIEGDNLEVLKLLQKSYAGKVKLIDIDPPYNTGKDFVYPDNFQDNIKNYLELTGQVEGGAKISSNTEASGRFHTDWLNMMYPRLKLSRNLLREDGLSAISIDDNEIDRLRLACAEVFGEENFAAQFVIKSNPRGSQSNTFSASVHEYVLCYLKNAQAVTSMTICLSEDMVEEYKLEDGNGKYRLLGLRLRGGAWRREERPLLYFPIFVDPTTESISLEQTARHFYKVLPIKPSTGEEGTWRWSQSKIHKDIDKLIAKKVSREGIEEYDIFQKDYVNNANGGQRGTKAKTIWDEKEFNYQNATVEVKILFDGEGVFDFPKPVSLIRRMLELSSDEHAIVLDFFAGFGTTGHAVMAQNAADGGNRRYILVQLPEPLDPENKDQKTAADFCDKLGRPRNIAEITKERLRRAGKKIKDENPMFAGDLGFRVFKLDSSNIRAWEPDRDNLEQTLLDHMDHIKIGRTESDILYELLLKLGLDLCVPIEMRTIADKQVHAIGGGVLLACLPDKIKRDEVEPLAQGIVEWHKALAPAGDTTCVFRDSAFADDVAKTNLAAILNQHGLTNVRSL